MQAGENGTVLHQRDRIRAWVPSTPPFCQSCLSQSLGSLLCTLPGLFPLLFCSPLLTPHPPVSSQLATQSLAAQEDSGEPEVAHVSFPPEIQEPSTRLVGWSQEEGWVGLLEVGMSTSVGCFLSFSRSLVDSSHCYRIGVGRADLVCAPPYSWSCSLPRPPGS